MGFNKLNWIDTHTHLNEDVSDLERDAIAQRSLEAGVSRIVLGGVNTDSIELNKNFCFKYPTYAYATIGLHPTEVTANFMLQLDEIESELQGKQKNSDVKTIKYVGIGETGLDFYRDRSFDKQQEEAFRIQIAWAKKYDLPLILHIRSAFEEAVSILKEEQDGSLKGVFHCFGGSVEQAKRAMDLGFFLGIGGVLTFKNAHLGETVRQTPLKYIVLETDAPYLAPHPYRGKTNESSYLPLIGYKMAEIQKIEVERVAETTTANATALYSL